MIPWTAHCTNCLRWLYPYNFTVILVIISKHRHRYWYNSGSNGKAMIMVDGDDQPSGRILQSVFVHWCRTVPTFSLFSLKLILDGKRSMAEYWKGHRHEQRVKHGLEYQFRWIRYRVMLKAVSYWTYTSCIGSSWIQRECVTSLLWCRNGTIGLSEWQGDTQENSKLWLQWASL